MLETLKAVKLPKCFIFYMKILNNEIKAGQQEVINLNIAKLHTGTSLAVQAPSHLNSAAQGISSIEDATNVVDLIPSQSEELQFQGISDLFDQKETVERLTEGVQEVVATPTYDQPAISGLRKSK